MPLPGDVFVDPSGVVGRQWYYLIIALYNRTGGAPGVDITVVQAQAVAAQTTATEAETSAAAAQTTANTAETSAAAANTAVAVETARALAAEALLATINDPVFTGAPPVFALFPSYASDAAAATGGIGIGQFYWSSAVTAVVQRRA